MALRKTYRSIVYKDLDTYIMVNGQKTLILFRGGSLQPPINGIYVTDSPDVIAAMDRDSGNGTSFRCVNVEGEPDKPVKTDKAEQGAKTKTTDAEKKTVPGITTLQEAKEYLLKNIEGLKPANMPNSKSVLNQAAKNGLEFPDLKQ